MTATPTETTVDNTVKAEKTEEYYECSICKGEPAEKPIEKRSRCEHCGCWCVEIVKRLRKEIFKTQEIVRE